MVPAILAVAPLDTRLATSLAVGSLSGALLIALAMSFAKPHDAAVENEAAGQRQSEPEAFLVRGLWSEPIASFTYPGKPMFRDGWLRVTPEGLRLLRHGASAGEDLVAWDRITKVVIRRALRGVRFVVVTGPAAWMTFTPATPEESIAGFVTAVGRVVPIEVDPALQHLIRSNTD